MSEYTIVTLRQRPDLNQQAAEFFHKKWKVPTEAYLDCINEYIEKETEYGWYITLCNDEIVSGLGVIENDFHPRKDLAPNICAVYTLREHRCKGLAGKLLNYAVEDLRAHGISPVYLLTGHDSFYERYGWELVTLVEDDEGETSRIYVHK